MELPYPLQPAIRGNPGSSETAGGGAIIAFVNNIDGMTDLYAQKVSSKGQLQPVQVFSPNGGETIASGSMGETIEWGAPAEAETFKLLYSIDNGLTWEMIDQGHIGSLYPWDVPAQPANKTKCKIKVIGYDASNMKVGSDVSDGIFTIEVLTITYPQNGSTCTSGQHCTVTWEKAPAVDAQAGQLFYSVDGGLTWKLITDAITGVDTSYDWTPTVKVTKINCKVKLIIKDGADRRVGTATSKGRFSIEAP
jgi:hypothetical protein